MLLDEDLLYRLIGERIRAARARKKLSQAKLADRLGKTRASVVNIESGRQRAPLHLLWRIAEELETEVTLLIPRQDEYRDSSTPIKLDSATLADIELAANGDPVAWRALTDFVKNAKSSKKADEDETGRNRGRSEEGSKTD